MRTPLLPVVEWTDAPADLNGLVHFTRKTKSGFCACVVIFQTQSTPQQYSSATFFSLPFHLRNNKNVVIEVGYSFTVSLALNCVTLFRVSQSNPCTGLDRPWKFQDGEVPRFRDNRHVHVVRLSAIVTGRLYPQKIFLVPIFVRSWVDSRSITLMSIENSSDIGNRTRDLPACSTLHQPNAPPRASMWAYRSVSPPLSAAVHRECKQPILTILWPNR